MNVAIVSLLAKPRMKRHEINYFIGFHHLVQSLKRHHVKLPKIVVLSPDLSKPPPGANKVVTVKAKNYERVENVQKAFGKSVYFKLDVFRMDYDRVVFLDADTLVLNRVDELWDPNCFNDADLYAIRESAELGLTNPDWQGRLNTGVMVINKPLLGGKIYDELLAMAQQGNTYDLGDQGVVNGYLQREGRIDEAGVLPPKYNLPSCIRQDGDWEKHQDSINIMHFLGPRKPWMTYPEHHWYHDDIQAIWDAEVAHHEPVPRNHPALRSSLRSRVVRWVQRYEEWSGKD